MAGDIQRHALSPAQPLGWEVGHPPGKPHGSRRGGCWGARIRAAQCPSSAWWVCNTPNSIKSIFLPS